jgi:nicotinamide mononucleotide adenylyltransferase
MVVKTEEKLNELAVVVGRFSHFHLGHKVITDKAIKESKKVIIFVGSSQEPKDANEAIRNALPFEMRYQMICEVYNHKDYPNVFVAPLPDIGGENDIDKAWNDNILQEINDWRKIFGIVEEFDAMYYGNDENRELWFRFRKAKVKNVKFYQVVRGEEIVVSATQLRELASKSKLKEWKKLVPKQIHPFFDALKARLLINPYYQELAEHE